MSKNVLYRMPQKLSFFPSNISILIDGRLYILYSGLEGLMLPFNYFFLILIILVLLILPMSDLTEVINLRESFF